MSEIIETGKFYRHLAFERSGLHENKRTLKLSFASEEPYLREYGLEVLSCNPESVRTARLSKLPLLLDHDHSCQIGVAESVRFKNGRAEAIVRFSKNQKAEEVWQDVLDGIRDGVSVGYHVHKMSVKKEKDQDIFRAVDWEPVEISITAVAADPTIGINRQAADKIQTTIIKGNDIMDPNADARVEQNRVANIRAIAQQSGAEKEGLDAIINGTDSEVFRKSCFESMITALEGNKVDLVDHSPNIGMNRREIAGYSFLKAIRAEISGDWRDAGLEKEASDAVKKQSRGKRDYRGLAIPYDVLTHKRDLTVGTDSAGGYTVATNLLSGSFIDLLDNAMMTRALGATVLTGLEGSIAIPKNSSAAAAYWVAEGADVTESAPAFSQVTMAPNTLGCMTDLTRKLILQSSLDVENFIRRHLAERLALGIDLAAINGTGADNQPLGILGTNGIGSVVGGTNGLAPAYDSIVELESDISASSADVGSLGYLTNSKVRGALKKVFTNATYGEVPVWCDGKMNGYRAEVSNQVPSNLTKGSSSGVCSAIIFGNWKDLVIGFWGGLDINVDRSTHSASGGVRIVVMQDVDVAIRNAESFSVMLDALTA